MKVENYQFPKSSFLSLEKDYALIIEKMLANERLKKLLYYDTSDALDREKLTQDQTKELLGKNIKITPKLKIDNSVLTYIIISFNNFLPTNNPEFRDNDIIFDIVCHFDTWELKDFQSRPFKIAGELDFLFNEARLTGIGKLEFLSGDQVILNDEYGVVTLMYKAVHGEDDKKGFLNPNDEIDYIREFDETYND